MSSSAARVYIQVETEAEQKEHLKQQRQTLKPLQGNVNDKENLTGSGRASIVDQLSRLKAGVQVAPKYGKRKCVDTAPAISTKDADTQTDAEAVPLGNADKPITAEDLTSTAEPGENYYKLLAEQRRLALEDSLTENRHLHERIEGLEEEMDTMRQELDEAKNLVEVLKEICEEDNSEVEEDDTTGDEDKVNA
uniref:Geminin n=1 Tax=Drosophila melanogaster TaxID=7227 RepID=Q7JX41_DROME|eukprot:NP_001260727.1 geminin, isoform B [Drosophila melanogaster]